MEDDDYDFFLSHINLAYQKVTGKYQLEFDNLKDEQEQTLQHILNGRDCLTVVPTGFGKSAIYFLLPLLKDEVCCACYLKIILFIFN